MISTPEVTGRSRIESSFEDTDQRYYWVRCPHCNECQVLKFSQVRWPKREPDKAVYVCEQCQGEMENHENHWGLRQANGGPQPQVPAGPLVFTCRACTALWGWFSWADAAAMFAYARITLLCFRYSSTPS